MALSVLLPAVGPTVLQLGSGDFLWWAVALVVLAIIAAALGFSGVAGVSMNIAKWLVIIFIILAVIALIL